MSTKPKECEKECKKESEVAAESNQRAVQMLLRAAAQELAGVPLSPSESRNPEPVTAAEQERRVSVAWFLVQAAAKALERPEATLH